MMLLRQGRRGQAMLEFGVGIIGAVAFFYVLLKCWMWMNQTLIERQQSFQQTRLAAGQIGYAGMPVPYQRPPLSLFGPGSVSNPPVLPDPETWTLPGSCQSSPAAKAAAAAAAAAQAEKVVLDEQSQCWGVMHRRILGPPEGDPGGTIDQAKAGRASCPPDNLTCQTFWDELGDQTLQYREALSPGFDGGDGDANPNWANQCSALLDKDDNIVPSAERVSLRQATWCSLTWAARKSDDPKDEDRVRWETAWGGVIAKPITPQAGKLLDNQLWMEYQSCLKNDEIISQQQQAMVACAGQVPQVLFTGHCKRPEDKDHVPLNLSPPHCDRASGDSWDY